jgi:cold shock CspA family protein
MLGSVARLDEQGKFGFIAGEDGREYFFHQAALNGSEFGELAAGLRVQFTPQERSPGDEAGEAPRASYLRPADEELPAVGNEQLPAEKLGRSS